MTSGYVIQETAFSHSDGPIFTMKRILGLALVIGAMMLAFVCLLLVTPGNPVFRAMNSAVTAENDRLILGPYPLKDDYPALKVQGVKTIVTLLDARLPYEGLLLEREKEMAEQNGIEVLNVPMTSILGHSLGGNYSGSAEQAAMAVEQASGQGKVYLHSYLGSYRVQTVAGILRGYHHPVEAAAESDRPGDGALLNNARMAFDAGRYNDTIALLGQINRLTSPGVTIRGWAQYRLGNISEAQNDFAAAIAGNPDDAEAATGLAYTHLRMGDLAVAEKMFRRVIAADSNNINAQQGLGMTLFRSARHEEARVVLRKTLSSDPDNTEVRETLAKIEP